MKKEINWQGLAAKIFCIAALVAAIAAVPTVIYKTLMPFALAFVVSVIIISAARKISAFTKLGEIACRLILLFSSFILISFLIFFVVGRLCGEITDILRNLYDGREEDTFLSAIEWLSSVLENFGGSDGEMSSRVYELISGLTVKVLSSLGDALSRGLTNLARLAPSALISLVAFVMSCIYFCLDYEKIIAFFVSFLPRKASDRISYVFKKALGALGGYFRAYMILFAITFGITFVGLSLLKREYALTSALGIALLDMLPFFGTGIVLLPWSLISLLMGNVALSIGLALLYAVITVIRAIAEPRIIGESIGISPMLSLISVYVGFKLFGAIGMLVSPIAAAVISSFFAFRKSEKAI